MPCQENVVQPTPINSLQKRQNEQHHCAREDARSGRSIQRKSSGGNPKVQGLPGHLGAEVTFFAIQVGQDAETNDLILLKREYFNLVTRLLSPSI